MLFLSRPGQKHRLLLLLFLFGLAAFNIQASEKVDINTAPLEELETITGVGPVIGQRIIEARPFSSLDDLIRVKGIGEITLQKIIDQGLAWVSEETKKTIQENKPIESSTKPIQESYVSGIVINEILPSPEGQDATEEWIEIFNQNEFTVDVSFWQITDTVGQTKTYTIPAGTTIKAKEFLVFDRPTTKIILNNSQDELLLIQPNGNATDRVSYTEALQGQSYNRTENDWIWSTVLTKGQANEFPLPAEETQTEKKQELETRQLAAISQQVPKASPLVFFLALGFAIFSAIIIFFTKRKLN